MHVYVSNVVVCIVILTGLAVVLVVVTVNSFSVVVVVVGVVVSTRAVDGRVHLCACPCPVLTDESSGHSRRHGGCQSLGRRVAVEGMVTDVSAVAIVDVAVVDVAVFSVVVVSVAVSMHAVDSRARLCACPCPTLTL